MPGYPRTGDRASDLTRARVSQQVLAARAGGELEPAGQGTPGDRVYERTVAAPSMVARAEVKAQVLEARANGELMPAGQGDMPANEAAAIRTARGPSHSNNFLALFHHNR